MKFASLVLLVLLPGFIPLARATKVGDSDAQVLKERGEPKSRIAAQDTEVWIYPDLSLDLRQHRVTAMEVIRPSMPAPAGNPIATPVPLAALMSRLPLPTTPADPQAAAKAQYQTAIDQARAIINQPVSPIPRTAAMHVSTYKGWFHPGATVPDFDTVDIRQTQECNYDSHPYVTSSERPSLTFRGPDLEFNSMTKILYSDRSVPKKKLTEAEMVEVNRLYRIIGRLRKELGLGATS